MFPQAGMLSQLHASGKADIGPLLKPILLSTVQVQGAQFACVHLYDPLGRRLDVAAHVGELPDIVAEAVNEATPWGRAMARGVRISAGDVAVSVDFARACSGGGYRAIESTPIISNSRETLGVISVFFEDPHLWTDQELRWTELSAQLIAEIIDRRRAERMRQASEFRFHSLLQNMPAAVYACDSAGYICLFNDAAVALWGRVPDPKRDQWCGAYKLFLPDGTPLSLETSPMAMAVKEGRATQCEVIVERRDGSRRLVRAYPQPMFDAAESVIGAVNMLVDITDLKNTQDALRDREDRFRRYFELGLIGMATTSPEKGILEVNDELCRILGYDRSELLTKTWAELTHPDDLAADVAQFNRVMAGEIDGYTLDKRWIRQDGQIIDTMMSAKSLRRSDGSVDYFVGLVQDITLRKKAERESADLKNALAAELAVMTRLHEFSTRLLTNTEVQPFLEEALSAVIAIQNADFGNVQLYHPDSGTLQIAAQHGFSEEFLDYFAAVDDDAAACGRAVKERQRIIIEDVATDPRFAPHRAIATAEGFRAVQSTPLFSAGGDHLGVISTHFRQPHRPSDRELQLTDLYMVHAAQIIERGRSQAALLRYQQELRALTARLIEIQEAQNRHLARELHDVFSQKLAVFGMELASLARRPPESTAALSAHLIRLTEHIGHLSKDIHQISRQLHPAMLDDLGLESALKNECIAFSEQHGIQSEFHASGIPRQIPHDIALCLYRVAQESLRNVARHSNALSVHITLAADGDEIVMEIGDSGDGFDPAEVKGHAGLGLVSMDERVRLVNGRFSVHSQPGKGTSVIVRVSLGVRS